jgi:hypothetical protein
LQYRTIIATPDNCLCEPLNEQPLLIGIGKTYRHFGSPAIRKLL